MFRSAVTRTKDLLLCIVNVLEGDPISEETTRESCVWLRFLLPKKVAQVLCGGGVPALVNSS